MPAPTDNHIKLSPERELDRIISLEQAARFPASPQIRSAQARRQVGAAVARGRRIAFATP